MVRRVVTHLVLTSTVGMHRWFDVLSHGFNNDCWGVSMVRRVVTHLVLTSTAVVDQ